MTYSSATYQSPVGELTLIASDKGLRAVLWENDDPRRVRSGETVEDEANPHLQKAITQLTEYFAGKRKNFDLTLDFAGTDFQKQVWHALLEIPYGETRSYGDIARKLGNDKAVRAVGAANGKNPISIIAPYHRVIGANGKLTGFAGGLKTKGFLLDLEKAA